MIDETEWLKKFKVAVIENAYDNLHERSRYVEYYQSESELQLEGYDLVFSIIDAQHVKVLKHDSWKNCFRVGYYQCINVLVEVFIAQYLNCCFGSQAIGIDFNDIPCYEQGLFYYFSIDNAEQEQEVKAVLKKIIHDGKRKGITLRFEFREDNEDFSIFDNYVFVEDLAGILDDEVELVHTIGVNDIEPKATVSFWNED